MNTRSIVLILSVLLPSAGMVGAGLGTNVTSPFKILTRADWNAKPPVGDMKTHKPTHITIHHTATPQKPERSLADKVKALQEFSQKPGKLGSGKNKPAWPDVPYHFYIDCNGGIAEGRDVLFVGDTNTEYDPSGHLLIVLEGNFEDTQPTPSQMKSLRQLAGWAMDRWMIPASHIAGHKDFATTACPGKHMQDLLPTLRKVVLESENRNF